MTIDDAKFPQKRSIVTQNMDENTVNQLKGLPKNMVKVFSFVKKLKFENKNCNI